MEQKTRYVFYQNEDIPELVAMLKKNNFYLARLCPSITPEKFEEVQVKRGLLFAGIARNDGDIIAYMAVYKNGCLKIAKQNQVYISSMLIDCKFHKSLYTLMDLYSLVMSEILKRGYTDIVAEVNENNLSSLFLLRKFGFILMNNKPDLYENLVLHNYAYGISKFIAENESGELNISRALSCFPVVNKRLAKSEDPVCYDKYIEQNYKCREREMCILINIHTGYACGIEMHHILKVYPVNSRKKMYLIENRLNIRQSVKIFQYCRKKMIYFQEITLNTEDQVEWKIMDKTDKFIITGVELKFSICFYPKEDMEKDQKEDRINFDETRRLDCRTGIFQLYHGTGMFFKEMWPCVTYPYLVGHLVPKHYELNHGIFKNGKCETEEITEQFILNRIYCVEKNKVSISTRMILKNKEIKIDPLFHIMLDDLQYRCQFTTEKSFVEKRFNSEDKIFCNEEVIYEDFLKENYTTERLKEIKIQAGKNVYQIYMEKPAACFYQFNYIGFKVYKQSDYYKDGWKAENGRIDFGTITIEKLF
ncbi:MAG: hypothetical protein LBQ71_13100 [Hungatella sp.]|jgi:L-amino acid N-acyltransferase YncA|nr:hypothetical protein [Hungatella sp.]